MGYEGNKDTKVTADIIQKQTDVTFTDEEMLKSNEKTQIESHCTDNDSPDGNKETDVTKDIIQEQPDVTFKNEGMLKSNEKIQIESHHTDNVSYDGNKDIEFTLVKEESIKINETLQNESHWFSFSFSPPPSLMPCRQQ